MKTETGKTRLIRRKIIIRLLLFVLIMSIVFFLPARTINFWEAWVFMGIMLTGFAIAISHFLKRDPDLLERRMRTKEKVKEQKWIIKAGYILVLPTFILPGFDKYYGWSDIPLFIIIVSDILIFLGYLFVIRVFKENSYASRIIETDTGQNVISTGPYAIVRHPMYTGVILMYGFTPLALGSYWALIGTFFLFVEIIFRIFSEEKFLSENLKGYKDYLLKTKYRLIPGIW